MYKTLSILVCAHNEEKTISNKIENILAVDINNRVDEIIVVNDNSLDKTSDIAAGLQKKYRKMALFENTHKKGKWGAILTGFEQANSDIVCITDADVFFEKNTIANALKLFEDPVVGAVTGSQKNVLIKDGEETAPFISFYEKCMNFFRLFESRIDSTISFHGQCMFIRKRCLTIEEEGLMADDVHIAVNIRRNGYRTLFCKDSYYIEKMPAVLHKDSRRIFQRRARAIAEAMIKNADILFNPKYKMFGFVCYPVHFLLHIVFPFFAIIASIAATVLLIYYKHILLLSILTAAFVINSKLVIMIFFQAVSVISYLLQPDKNKAQWIISRD